MIKSRALYNEEGVWYQQRSSASSWRMKGRSFMMRYLWRGSSVSSIFHSLDGEDMVASVKIFLPSPGDSKAPSAISVPSSNLRSQVKQKREKWG
jgi:hypothetical protein